MWITKWYLENQIRQRDELERRVKRLELILLQDAKNKIASLKDEEAGTNKKVLSDQGKIVTDIFYADGEEYGRELRICLLPQEWKDLEEQFFYQELKRYFDKKIGTQENIKNLNEEKRK